MANQPSSPAKTRRLRPRPAASLVIIDRTSPASPRLLMGRRSSTQVFLPNTYVFPGGRVEPADGRIAAVLPRRDPSPATARLHTFAAAAIRETFEETGLIIGAPLPSGHRTKSKSWKPFLAQGVLPATGAVTLFARAVTPPGRPRRYDTRFFWIDHSAISAAQNATDGELLDLDWVTLEAARTLPLASITHHILREVEAVLTAASNAEHPASERPIPFFRQYNRRFERVLLSHHQAVA